jgi:hypothetical protein
MWLIFAWRRQYKLYEQVVFVTYWLSFVMALLVSVAFLARAEVPTAWVLLLIPVHMFRQLKRAYLLRWFSALWRTVALQFVTFTVMFTFGTTLLALGLLG